jgi:hypothetical protein
VTRGKNLLEAVDRYPGKERQPGSQSGCQEEHCRGEKRGWNRGRAMPIHRVEGLSMDSAVIDIGSDVCAHSQAYVAMSRVHSLERVFLSNITEAKIDRLLVFREYDRLLSITYGYMDWTHEKSLMPSGIGTGCQ